MKLLYGTGNQAKLAAMRNRLRQIGIELVGLNDLKADGLDIPKVVENGNTPLENARLKAKGYYEAFHIPVFSCDSGLYFDNVPDEIQPGVHVRNVNGKRLSDDEMIDYYSGLVKIYGNLVARYKNAICFVMDDTHMYEAKKIVTNLAKDGFCDLSGFDYQPEIGINDKPVFDEGKSRPYFCRSNVAMMFAPRQNMDFPINAISNTDTGVNSFPQNNTEETDIFNDDLWADDSSDNDSCDDGFDNGEEN